MTGVAIHLQRMAEDSMIPCESEFARALAIGLLAGIAIGAAGLSLYLSWRRERVTLLNGRTLRMPRALNHRVH